MTVNSTADNQANDGACTLREAIVASNTDTVSGAAGGECAAGSGAGDLIEFDISGSGLKTIHITSGLPSITRTVTIDGYTQTDAVVNTADFPDPMNGTLTVEIDAGGESGIYGFDINGSQADDTVIKGLIVNDIPYETFYLTDVDNVSLEGNYIGTSSTGNAADGGSSHGVRIGGSSTGNIIGGSTAAKRNVISGNGNTGVLFYGSAQTTGNYVQGNFIGVGADGTTRIGNSQQGVASSEGSTGNTIGGDGVGEGNVISGNGGVGVYLAGTGGANTVQGNHIGTNAAGSAGVYNGQGGVTISNSDSNIIGGSTAGARNVISGNSAHGISIISGSSGNTATGNFIGLGSDGTTDLGNGTHGIQIADGAPNNTIGGDTSGERNVISGNDGSGIDIEDNGSDSTTIQGNYIGTDATGVVAKGNTQDGIYVAINVDLTVIGGDTSGERNVISGNDGNGVHMTVDVASSVVSGNYIGVNAAGDADLGNAGHGLRISGGSNLSTIGGDTSDERNIISGNGASGISIHGSSTTNNTVSGNYIGTNASGDAAIGNSSDGVNIDISPSNVVGGTTTGERNVISGNTSNGVGVYGENADENTVQGNYIGSNSAGSGDLGNGAVGVIISTGADSTLVGGTSADDANLIKYNDNSGVVVSDSGSLTNSIIGNSLYGNTPPNIDLADDGSTANDANDADSGPNDLLNFPEWSTYAESGGNTEVEYTLDVPAGDYRIETFSDSGKTLIDSQNISHTGSGSESFSNTITGDGYSATKMTATEIDGGLSSGFGSTSEYSEAYSDGSETITVNSIADDMDDDGECTLREAITAANDNIESGISDGECIAGSNEDTIEFDIVGPDYTIQPLSALPSITADNVTINGYSQTGAVENSGDYSACFVGTILIEIDGQNAGATSGITISANNVTVRGLAINRFANDGVNIGAVDGTVVAGNILGLDDEGLVDLGNGDAGVEIGSTGDTLIGGTTAADRNLISGNEGYGGISSYADAGTTTISGNCIGTDATGDTAIPNNYNGINLYQAGANMVIGGDSTHERNVISGNDDAGISLDDSSVGDIKGNYIGVDVDGEADLGNGINGISLMDADSSVAYIGGLTSGERNVISGNDSDGIYLANGTGDTIIRGNYIGTDATGTTDLGNSDDGIIAGSTDIIIGGTTSGARNVVSGNGAEGINLTTSATSPTIQGNYVGLNAAGTSGLGNTGAGIRPKAANSTVGGTATGAGNVVSGNTGGGIYLEGAGSVVQGNLVGTSADGLTAIGNTSFGIEVAASNITVGGNTSSERNVVAAGVAGGNFGGVGIAVLSFGQGNSGGSIQGNYVGTNINGVVGGGFGNASSGIQVIGDFSNLLIGGSNSGEGNKVAGSSGANGHGISVFSFTGLGLSFASNVSIVGNEVEQNNTTGIRLANDSTGDFQPDTAVPYPNDGGDGDAGTNEFMNFPSIDSTTASDGELEVQFDLDVPVNADGYRVEFFANDTGDASGNGEGQIYLGSTDVAASGNNQTATITLEPGVIDTGTYDITATTTKKDASGDGFGSTSEFSAFLNDQSVIQPTDNDGDGVADSIEDAGPNGGDGNDDGTLDGEQGNVATILDAEDDDYITLELDSAGECDQIDDFASKLESELSESDPDFIYPLTLVEFTIPCEDSVDGTIFWHGEEEFTTQVYRKFGPTTPGDSSTTSWYTAEQFITSTEDIGGEATATASFTLTDGEAGDDTGNDNVIVDANGPGLDQDSTDSVIDSISSAVSDALSATGMNQYGAYVLAGALIAGGSAVIIKRKFFSKTAK
ncbi:MAG TPA: CSLREA domain-containing protein [Candidatus Saccharibacteria bacterium]|nr:CSLREA domain-containing protein [Candidatus Saccharibacteria bacterium]